MSFVKHIKFDDKDDNRKDVRDNNRTGTQGPPGANGTQAPLGIVNAELCPAGIDLENVYVLNGTNAESCDISPTICKEYFEQILTHAQISAYLTTIGHSATLEQFCEDLESGGLVLVKQDLDQP